MSTSTPTKPAGAPREPTHMIFAQAIDAHKSGDLESAERGYRHVLSLKPSEIEAHYLLGAVLVQLGHEDQAIPPLTTYLERNPKHAAALNALGTALSKTGQYDGAINAFNRAIEAQPSDLSLVLNLGRALFDADAFEDAAQAFARVLIAAPNQPDASLGQASCAAKLGDIETSINVLQRCVDSGVGTESVFALLASHLLEERRFSDAHSYALKGRTQWPDSEDLLLADATALRHIEPISAARPLYEELLRRDPNNSSYRNKFSTYLYDLGLWEEAEAQARTAIEIDPESGKAINNLGRIRQQRGDLDEGRRLYEQSIRLLPTYADAYNNLGNLLLYIDRIDDALAHFNKAITLKPDSKGFIFNRSVALMTSGEIGEHLPDHRTRFEKEEPTPSSTWPWPMWSGEDLSGKHVFTWGEQGIGDEIIHARCAQRLSKQAASCTLECAERLVKLFARSFPDVNVRAKQESNNEVLLGGPFDYQASTLDMNCWHYRSEEDIPSAPYLTADPDMTQALRSRYLEQNGNRPLIGISWWSGNAQQSHFKSTPLEAWKGILSIPNITFVNLQYGDRRAELTALATQGGLNVIDDPLVDPMGDMDPFAAQVAAMDHVITISNATAHMAGALGVPVWNMTPTGPGRIWYWFVEGSNSPWYSSMRLFRHYYDAGWNNVLQEIKIKLEQMAPSLGSPTHLPY